MYLLGDFLCLLFRHGWCVLFIGGFGGGLFRLGAWLRLLAFVGVGRFVIVSIVIKLHSIQINDYEYKTNNVTAASQDRLGNMRFRVNNRVGLEIWLSSSDHT